MAESQTQAVSVFVSFTQHAFQCVFVNTAAGDFLTTYGTAGVRLQPGQNINADCDNKHGFTVTKNCGSGSRDQQNRLSVLCKDKRTQKTITISAHLNLNVLVDSVELRSSQKAAVTALYSDLETGVLLLCFLVLYFCFISRHLLLYERC
ncbi:hypothetical protein ILYODFUR_036734 [Ilyodon furcidens]|uniref:Uncharacterized protein n=1 Tax=Ilyodon furcidens TaxID=33524 RepID=A0ABV0SS57_9TELE